MKPMRCTYKRLPAHTGCTNMHAYPPTLSCGKSSRCKLWPWHEGSKVKKFVFPGLLPIIYSWNKEEGMERLREGERQRGIPQREAFDVENKISFLICPLIEYTWHILSSYTLSASSSPFLSNNSVYLRVCVCVCCGGVCDFHVCVCVCVWDRRRMR